MTTASPQNDGKSPSSAGKAPLFDSLEKVRDPNQQIKGGEAALEATEANIVALRNELFSHRVDCERRRVHLLTGLFELYEKKANLIGILQRLLSSAFQEAAPSDELQRLIAERQQLSVHIEKLSGQRLDLGSYERDSVETRNLHAALLPTDRSGCNPDLLRSEKEEPASASVAIQATGARMGKQDAAMGKRLRPASVGVQRSELGSGAASVRSGIQSKGK